MVENENIFLNMIENTKDFKDQYSRDIHNLHVLTEHNFNIKNFRQCFWSFISFSPPVWSVGDWLVNSLGLSDASMHQ